MSKKRPLRGSSARSATCVSTLAVSMQELTINRVEAFVDPADDRQDLVAVPVLERPVIAPVKRATEHV